MKTKLSLLIAILALFLNNTTAQVPELWGMTSQGDQSNNLGKIFKTDINGENQTVEYSFDKAMGSTPYSELCEASNGKLYGMTLQGGATNDGILFEYDPIVDTYNAKVYFDGTNKGKAPYGGLIQASNGMLYGMTSQGGVNDKGVLFEYDPTTNIYTKKLDFNGTNGHWPYGSLIQTSNGKLYGMTSGGGIHDYGVLFEYNTATSIYTKKIDFNDTIGRTPNGSLMQASNGKLYGMTWAGGAFINGVLFEYDISANTLNVKVDFYKYSDMGYYPWGSLEQASNGKLYGMTNEGGINDKGVLFEYNISTNTYTKKLDFDGANNGRNPHGNLMQASNGMLYGMTSHGGTNDLGVLFKYNPTTSTYSKEMDFIGVYGSKPYGSLNYHIRLLLFS